MQITNQKVVNQFQGEYSFLSNFWSCKIVWDGIEFPTLEHAYQYSKCANFTDATRILLTDKAGKAKIIGNTVAKVADWENKRLGVMLDLLRIKFMHEPLRTMLLNTNNMYLSEGSNWHDEFWGVNLKTGVGQNHLGRLLMQVRDEIRKEIMTKIISNNNNNNVYS